MRALVVMIALLGAGLSLAACTSSNGNNGGGGADLSSFASSYCSLFTPCCADAGLSTNGQSCRALISLAASQGTYNPSAGSACLTATQQAQSKPDFCTTLGGNPMACSKVFNKNGGALPPGAQCMNDSDCAPSPDGSRVQCFFNSTFADGGSVETRTCEVQPVSTTAGDKPCVGTVDGTVTNYNWNNGTPPGTGYVCDKQSGLYCDSKTNTCLALGNVGGMCGSAQDCVTNAFCDFSMQKCVARVPAGSACMQYDSCDTTSYCDQTSHKCVMLLADGTACSASQSCQSGSCVNGACAKSGLNNLGLSLVCGM
jgi:hypothetical protein